MVLVFYILKLAYSPLTLLKFAPNVAFHRASLSSLTPLDNPTFSHIEQSRDALLVSYLRGFDSPDGHGAQPDGRGAQLDGCGVQLALIISASRLRSM